MSALQDFFNQSPNEWFQMSPGLTRIYEACERFGHPERNCRIIHVAGTNGKGSVTTLIASMLQEAGFKVGTFTSPHLNRVNERFQINKVPIAEDDLKEIITEIHDTLTNESTPQIPLTFFEQATLIAFLYFSKQQVDFAVIETGLGGRLDSTNIVIPLLSVITEIGIDHAEILGNTLEAIATEKAGIIKYKTPLVCGVTTKEAQRVIAWVAQKEQAPLFWSEMGRSLFDGFFNWGRYNKLELGLGGDYQFQNAFTALTAVRQLKALGFDIPEAAIRKGLKDARWPGRFEVVLENPLVILDGAHNVQGIEKLVESLHQKKHWWVLFAAARDKQVTAMLEKLSKKSSRIFLCGFDHLRFASADELKALSQSLPKTPCEFISEHRPLELAYSELVAQLPENTGLLITGSLYFVGKMRGMFLPSKP